MPAHLPELVLAEPLSEHHLGSHDQCVFVWTIGCTVRRGENLVAIADENRHPAQWKPVEAGAIYAKPLHRGLRICNRGERGRADAEISETSDELDRTEMAFA